ncbi:MAG: hypothetical protein LAT65_17255 [Saccharospirillum sp.]|nr:hypothetical protein [Saccharospirillum sp.]
MDAIKFRQFLIDQLRLEYKRLDSQSDPLLKDAIQTHIDLILHQLDVLDRGKFHAGAQFTAENQAPASSNARPHFSDATVRRIMAEFGYAESRDKLDKYRRYFNEIERRARQYCDHIDRLLQNRFELDTNNPYRQWGGLYSSVRMLFLHSQSGLGRATTIDEELNQWEARAFAYMDGRQSSIHGAALLPLFQNADLIQNLVELEQSRLPELEARQQRRLAPMIDQRFGQENGLALWELLQENAYTLQNFQQEENRLSYLTEATRRVRVSSDSTPLMLGRHPLNSVESTQTVLSPATLVNPRFQDEDGNPLKNTQILCWRYHKDRPEELADMRVDRQVSELFTVGILYTDENGDPTLFKPAFMANEHNDIIAQVDPDTGDFLLLERHTGHERPDSAELNDPLKQTWFSWDNTDHAALLEKVVGQLGDTGHLDPLSYVRGDGDLMHQGMTAAGRISSRLTATPLSGYLELTAGYDYGFMAMPLGYGSLSIKALHTLPNRQDANHPVCVRETVAGGTYAHIIKLPRTLRQFTHEVTQQRATLTQAYEQLLNVNQNGLNDLFQIESLKDWLTIHKHAPFQPHSSLNLDAHGRLNTALTSMQSAIRNRLVSPPLVDNLANGNAAEQALYASQEARNLAVRRFQQALERSFALIEDTRLVPRLKAWQEVQASLESSDQDQFVGWLERKEEHLLDPDKAQRAFTDQTPRIDWQPAQSINEEVAEPYIPQFFDALAALLASLVPAVQIEPEDSNLQRLFDGHLLPIIAAWISTNKVTEVLQYFLKFAAQDNPSSVDNNIEKFQEQSNPPGSIEGLNNLTSNTPSILKDIIDPSVEIFKTTFIRGPGAPALLEAVLDLSGHLVQTRLQYNVTLQTRLAVRLYSVQFLLLVQVNQQQHYNRIGRLLYRTLAYNNPLRMQQLLSSRDLISRAGYGGQVWSGGTARVRAEARIKTGLIFWEGARFLFGFMNEMDPEKRLEPSAADFRSATYRFGLKLGDSANAASMALGIPAMVSYWQSQGRVPGQLHTLLERQFTNSARHAARNLFGRAGGSTAASLIGTSTVGSVVQAWASRLSFLAAGVATATSLADMRRNLQRGQTDQATLNAVSAAGTAATLLGGSILGFTKTALLVGLTPALGQVLFIAGAVISIGALAWSLYWNHWGMAHFYGRNFVVFHQGWRAIVNQPHSLEYTDTDRGATNTMVNLTKTIEDLQRNTVYENLGRSMAQNAIEQSRLLINIHQFVRGRPQLDPISLPQDVRWKPLSWLALPHILDFTDLLGTRFYETFDLTEPEVDAMGEMYKLDEEKERKESAKFHWRFFIADIKHYANEDSDRGRHLKAFVWEPLNTTGHYPTEIHTQDMAKLLAPFWGDERLAALEQLCFLWKLRSTEHQRDQQSSAISQPSWEAVAHE